MILTASVQTSELQNGEQRLDAFYYAGGGRAAQQRLEQAGLRLQRLDQVASAPFMGNRFARFYVRKADFGIPFLGPSEMQLAEITDLPLVSRVRTQKLDDLRIRRGWILISRSGAIGNFAYVREDMDGLIGSDDLIRITPCTTGAPVGYLFAFLCSPVGQAMLKRSTYGAVIQHIEPHHISALPIPRVAEATELAIHELIERAAAKRAEANGRLRQARARVYAATGLKPYESAPVGRNLAGTRTYLMPQSRLGTRLEARYHDALVGEIEERIRSNGHCGWASLGECAEVFLPDRGKWINVSAGGIPLVGSGDMFLARPVASRHVSTQLSPRVTQLLVQTDDILVARSGQIYSILGDTVMVGRHLAGKAVSEHAIRVRARPVAINPGYLYAFLSLADYGYGQIIRTAYGTSIPSLSVDEMPQILVPLAGTSDQLDIGSDVMLAVELRDEANDLEDEAQRILSAALGFASQEADR